MSANFWFATAKLLHFFELRKNNTKKSPFISENTNGDKKKSVLLTSFGKFLDFRHYNCKATTFMRIGQTSQAVPIRQQPADEYLLRVNKTFLLVIRQQPADEF